MENTNPRPNKYEYNTGGAQYGYEFVSAISALERVKRKLPMKQNIHENICF